MIKILIAFISFSILQLSIESSDSILKNIDDNAMYDKGNKGYIKGINYIPPAEKVYHPMIVASAYGYSDVTRIRKNDPSCISYKLIFWEQSNDEIINYIRPTIIEFIFCLKSTQHHIFFNDTHTVTDEASILTTQRNAMWDSLDTVCPATITITYNKTLEDINGDVYMLSLPCNFSILKTFDLSLKGYIPIGHYVWYIDYIIIAQIVFTAIIIIRSIINRSYEFIYTIFNVWGIFALQVYICISLANFYQFYGDFMLAVAPAFLLLTMTIYLFNIKRFRSNKLKKRVIVGLFVVTMILALLWLYISSKSNFGYLFIHLAMILQINSNIMHNTSSFTVEYNIGLMPCNFLVLYVIYDLEKNTIGINQNNYFELASIVIFGLTSLFI